MPIAKSLSSITILMSRLLPISFALRSEMPVNLAVLDKFHPQIRATIEAAIPSDWTARFIEDNSLAARKALIRSADIVFVMAAPMPKDMLTEAHRLRLIQNVPHFIMRPSRFSPDRPVP
jgi:hypothetical protein